jgi:hypothetical protein
MDAAAQHFARSSMEAGRRPEDVVQSLVSAGWPPQTAWDLVRSVQPPPQSDPRLWMAIVSFALGLVFVLVDLIMFFSIFAAPGGPRGVLAQFTDGTLPVGLWLATLLPLWLVSMVLVIIHSVLGRRQAKVPRRGRALAAISWIRVIGNPILAGITVVVVVVVYGALGIMCGEAVGQDCGM